VSREEATLAPEGELRPNRRGASPVAHRQRRRLLGLILTLPFALSACSSSPKSSTTTTAPSAVATRQAIRANWVAFFSGSTAAARKVALLENGKSFARIIDAQASSALAKSVDAKVPKVTITSSTQATVRYSLDLGGKPALTNQEGQAVLQNETWKVGVMSFCALLTLEQVPAPACPTPSTSST